jgi:class 3 adenylate cyclase
MNFNRKKMDEQDENKKKKTINVDENIRFVIPSKNHNIAYKKTVRDILRELDEQTIEKGEIKYTNPRIRDWDIASFDKKIQLEDEINQLKSKLSVTLKDLETERTDKKEKVTELKGLLSELQSKEKINHILPRICEEAREKLFVDEDFKNKFENGNSYETVVVSIDIRRSTELMLKARKPELFSKFITELSEKLSQAILSNFGIFDKFTGDGILAFFPKFYSGEEAIVRALIAADECHKIFKKHYSDSRNCFNVFIKDVGLGIGIDFGIVTLVNTSNELTVVGIPVVYACRMSGAKAGDTLLNQPAKEELTNICQNNLKVIESEITIKNEGIALAYKAEFTKKIEIPNRPKWLDV